MKINIRQVYTAPLRMDDFCALCIYTRDTALNVAVVSRRSVLCDNVYIIYIYICVRFIVVALPFCSRTIFFRVKYTRDK